MRRLLFLNGIKAFEAAARSGSFAAAGAELNVSPAAISRMVHLLEERLGVPLFERKANKLALTQAGLAREDSYRLVQKNAMRAWNGEGDLLTLLKADAEVAKALPAAQLEAMFDLGYHLKAVDVIFGRVFGTASN